MRRLASCSSIALGLTLLWAPSCKVQVGKAAKPAAGGDPVAKPAGNAGADGTSPARANPEPSASNVSVWGHFVLADPAGTLKRVSERLVPPMLAGMLSPTQFKPMLAGQMGGSLGSRATVVEHIDLSKPFGCVMVDPEQHEQPVACAFGYQGGMSQLIEDMGKEGYLSGGADFASYEISGDEFYFKAWGEHIGVAMDPSLLASVQPKMKRSVLQPGKANRDVYVEALPSVIKVDAREELEQFGREMEAAMTMSGQGAQAQATAEAGLEMYRSLGDLTSAQMLLKVGAQRTALIYRGTAGEGTPSAQQYARDAKLPTVDVAMLEALPDDAWVVGASNFDFEHLMDDLWMGPYIRMIGAMVPNMSVEEFFAAMGETFAGPASFAIYPVEGSVGAIGVSYAVEPKADSMAMMRTYLTKYKLEDLGPMYAENVRTTYKKNAFTVGGAKVDTYTITPTKKAMKELRSSPDFARLKKVLGTIAFTVAYMQEGDRQYMVMTSSKAKEALTRMTKAAAGKGSLGKFGDARKRVKKHADGTTLVMLDVRGMLTWARTLDMDGELKDLPKVGVGLDDVVWTSKIDEGGKKEYEVSLAQPFIEQLRSI